MAQNLGKTCKNGKCLLRTPPIRQNSFQIAQKAIFLAKMEKSKMHFSRFQGPSTRKLLKIKRPNGAFTIEIYFQTTPFLSQICGGWGFGINQEIKPLSGMRIFSLQAPYNLIYPPRNKVRRMGTYSGIVLSHPISKSLNSCKFSQN